MQTPSYHWFTNFILILSLILSPPWCLVSTSSNESTNLVWNPVSTVGDQFTQMFLLPMDWIINGYFGKPENDSYKEP